MSVKLPNPTTGSVIYGSDGQQIRVVSVDQTGAIKIAGILSVNQSGTIDVRNITGTVALPTGASTSALQTTANTTLSTISGQLDVNLSTRSSESTLSALNAKFGSLGQALMSASAPVVIASNQSAIPASQSGTWTIQPGNTANTTPWLSTVSQGGNSAVVSAGGALKVDNSAVTQPISGTVTANIGTSGSLALSTIATAVQTTVSVTSVSTQLLASNANRKGLIITNVGGNTCYISFGTAPTTALYSVSLATTVGNEQFRMFTPVYTGAINAIRGSGTTNVIVTEFT